jgi:hypothetical protein
MMGLQHYDVAIFWRSPKCATEGVIVGTAGEVNRLRAKSKTEVRISSSRVGRPKAEPQNAAIFVPELGTC